jgi:hypothetical protein
VNTNLDRFKDPIAKLTQLGERLSLVMQIECGVTLSLEVKEQLSKENDEYFKNIVPFHKAYQRWYSEALALVRQLLPDRVEDFKRHYEKPKNRKDLTCDNYCIEDYLQGLTVTRPGQKEKVVGPEAAISRFSQQLAIVESAKARFDSSLFDIRRLVQADLLDSELEAAEELAKHKFARAAGAVAGVVLERHLGQVTEDHSLPSAKKNPTISSFDDLLKASGVIDLPQWRFIQHLGDIRNMCDHASGSEPTPAQVEDLISGVKKVTKTVF